MFLIQAKATYLIRTPNISKKRPAIQRSKGKEDLAQEVDDGDGGLWFINANQDFKIKLEGPLFEKGEFPLHGKLRFSLRYNNIDVSQTEGKVSAHAVTYLSQEIMTCGQ